MSYPQDGQESQEGLGADDGSGGVGLADAILSHAARLAEGDERDSAPYAIDSSVKMIGLGEFQFLDVIKLIAWVGDFKEEEEAERHGETDSNVIAECDRLIEKLRAEYQVRARLNFSAWIQGTSWERGLEVTENAEGHLITSDPEDLVFAIKAQLSLAEQYLSPEGNVQVMADYISEIKRTQDAMRSALDSDWKNMSIERLCTVVNDCSRLAEECPVTSCTNNCTDQGYASPTSELKSLSDEMCQGYASLASQASNLVASSIMEFLKEPTLSSVFSATWQNESGGDLVLVCTATLRAYFGNVSTWIPRNFYCRVVARCLTLMLEGYLEGAFSQPLEPTFNDARSVSATLLKDRLDLIEFFGSEYWNEVNLGSKRMKGKQDVEDAFEILRAMSTIICAAHVTYVVEEMYILLRELGCSNAQATTLYLVRKSRQCTRKQLQSWTEKVKATCGGEISEMIQPRLQCNLVHLSTKPKVVRAISGAVTRSRNVRNKAMSSLQAQAPGIHPDAVKYLNTPQVQKKEGKFSATDAKPFVENSKDATASSRKKQSIKALVEADMLLNNLSKQAGRSKSTHESNADNGHNSGDFTTRNATAGISGKKVEKPKNDGVADEDTQMNGGVVEDEHSKEDVSVDGEHKRKGEDEIVAPTESSADESTREKYEDEDIFLSYAIKDEDDDGNVSSTDDGEESSWDNDSKGEQTAGEVASENDPPKKDRGEDGNEGAGPKKGSGKKKAGREKSDKYKFGDLSRGIVGQVGKSKALKKTRKKLFKSTAS